MCGLDFDFIMDRLEKLYLRFLVHNDKSIKFASAIVRQQLVEGSGVDTRIKRYFVSMKPVASSSNCTASKVDKWNVIFVFIMSERLPKDTFESWEQSCESKTTVQFLENRVHTLQAMKKSFGKVKIQAAVAQVPIEPVAGSSKTSPTRKGIGNNQLVPGENPVIKCKMCSGNHRNYKCPKLSSPLWNVRS